MSQYDWTNAPEWANYGTRDRDGFASWWENRPDCNVEFGCFQSDRRGGGRSATIREDAPIYFDSWMGFAGSIERRPTL